MCDMQRVSNLVDEFERIGAVKQSEVCGWHSVLEEAIAQTGGVPEAVALFNTQKRC